MLKNISKLELKIEDKIFSMLCDSDSSLHHVKEALFQFQGYIAQIEANVKAQQESQEKESESKVEEIPQEQLDG